MLCLFAAPAMAQNAAPAPVQQQAATGDMAQRLELSKKMHAIQPARIQVEKAVALVAQRIPEANRESFKSSMMASIDTAKLEASSINAMAQMFTVRELQHMIAYFQAPEAKTIAEKMPNYYAQLQPEVMKMVDAAMMAARTGAVAPAPAPGTAAPAGTTPAQ
jgi:hypothetical protein